MSDGDPFQHSLMAQPAHKRLLVAVFILAALWIAILWAVSLA